MSPPRRILFVNHEVECGGAELSLLELIQGLDPDRFEVHLACSMEGPLTDRARELGAEIHLVPMLFAGKFAKFVGIVRAGLKLRRLIRTAGIHLVHTNSLIAGYCGIFAAKLSQVPAVWHVRDIRYPDPAKTMCARAERVIANSNATAASLNFPPRHRDRVHVVYNGVAPAFFCQPRTDREVRAELHVPPGEKLIGVFGRLDPWKGHDVLLNAARRVLARHPETTLVVVGDMLFRGGTARRNRLEELEELSRELGIFGKVRFLGQRRDVPRLLGGMDVVAHPSSQPEPFGRAIAEAHATGVPVVASDLGGIPEIVDHGVNGYLFVPGDADDLAAQLCTLLADGDHARALGENGRESARQRFAQGVYAADVTAIYDGLPT